MSARTFRYFLQIIYEVLRLFIEVLRPLFYQ